MSTPAFINLWIISGDELTGPTVATILVLRADLDIRAPSELILLHKIQRTARKEFLTLTVGDIK